MSLLSSKGGLGMLTTKPPEDGGKSDISNKLRSDWNAYTEYLSKKGLKGHPSLDKNDLGGKMIDQYRKENPTTLVSRENIKPIQQEFSKYRDWVINEARNKKAIIDVPEDQFMRGLSTVDGIPGQRTTSFSFPNSYLTTILNGKNLGRANEGFATTNKK